jgi:DNA adenine methylase
MKTRRPAKLRPALKWHGGKNYLARRIVSLLPAHRTYVEPFAGGLSVLLNKPRSEIEVAGDLNSPLIEFYRCLQVRPEELISRLQSIAYTRENFEWACQASQDQDPIERAVRFLVRNRLSRGGLARDFAWSERLRGGQPGDVNGWQTIIEQLPAIARRLQGVEFHHGDALDPIKTFDGPETLHYLDPPYLSVTRTAKDVYAHEMNDADHARLLDTIVNLQGMAVISGYANPLYNIALRSWGRIEIPMANHSGQTKVKSRRVEIVWLSPSCDRFTLRG